MEIENGARCGGMLKVIASIEEPAVIAKILAHLECTVPDQYQSELPLEHCRKSVPNWRSAA